MIPELPFDDADRAALDDGFAAVDRELDALFLEEVGAVLRRLRAERAERAAAPDGAAA